MIRFKLMLELEKRDLEMI